MAKKVIVTGGLGFLGQYLVSTLTEKYPDLEIVVLARSKRPFFLSDFSKNHHIKIVYDTDTTVPSTIEEYFKGAETVFHTAALVSFWRKDKEKLFHQNVDGTENIVNLCKKHGTKLIYISSTAALGFNNDKDNPANEKFQFNWKKARKFAYMLSKYHSEKVVRQGIEIDLQAIIVNISTIFGPGDERVFALLNNLKNHKIPFMLPGGFAAVDVRDGVAGILALYEKGQTGNSYLVTGGNYTYEEFMNTASGSLGVSAPTKTLPPWLGRLLTPILSLGEGLAKQAPKMTAEIFAPGLIFRYYTVEKLVNETGWKAEYSLEQTFNDVVQYYNKSLEA